MLNLLAPEDLKEARWLLGYPEESVGRLMTPDYVAVHPEWTVAQALDHIRAQGMDSETINRVFVIDDRWHLLDDIELRRFILAPPQAHGLGPDGRAGGQLISAFADREEAGR
jgi:magnesium transporter